MLTKEQGKGTLALPKNLPRLLITSWHWKDVWKTLSQNKSSGTINPMHLPRKLLNNTKNVSINKTLSISNSCPHTLSCNLGGTFHLQPWTWIVFCFGKHAMERNASTLTQDLGWDDIEGHLLEQLLKPMLYTC